MKTKLFVIYSTVVILSAICHGAEEWLTIEAFEDARSRYNGIWAYPQDALASNVYMQVRQLYEADGTTPFDHFLGVRGGGMNREMARDEYMPFVSFVSNNCAVIAADWQSYETNEVVRFSVLSAVGFSGLCAYTNFACSVLSLYEANTNSCSWRTIRMIHSPYGTDAEGLAALNYDVPGMSNIITRIRALAEAVGDTNVVWECDYRLSGHEKQELLELQAAGVL